MSRRFLGCISACAGPATPNPSLLPALVSAPNLRGDEGGVDAFSDRPAEEVRRAGAGKGGGAGGDLRDGEA